MSAALNLLENTPLERNILREEISGKGSRRSGQEGREGGHIEEWPVAPKAAE